MAAAVLLAAAVAVVMAAAASTQLAAAADAPLPLVAPAPVGLPNCTTTCGDVPVPYPFGLGPPRCSWPGFNLTCDDAAGRPGAPPRLLLGDGTLEVVDVSLRNTTVRVVRRGDVANITSGRNVTFGRSFTGYSGFTLSDRNELVLSGCNVVAMLVGDLDEYSNIISGCASFCSSSNTSKGEIRQPAGKYCSGLGCCQAPVSMNYSRPEGVQVSWLRGGADRQQDLLRLEPFVLVAEKGWFDQRPVADQLVGPPGGSQRPDAATIEVPLVLEWTVNNVAPRDDRYPGPACSPAVAQRLCRSANSECTTNGNGDYSCQCRGGYDGNPYLDGGCQGFSAGIGLGSGAGLILLALVAVFVTKKIRHRRVRKLKQKFFSQNRGQLLHQLVSQRADIAERMIITLDELEKATNNFDRSREIGGGGHGTVYKGILSDLQVVAIKKSKITVQKEIDEFINEVAILSQINHRNIVRLLGCCLETEVPLLVYEFISNGTLFHHLHVEGPTSIPWDSRLRIAAETAKALAYLHWSVSTPVIHRDIKSSNILLDDTMTSKVSDFGASRYAPMDSTGLTTKVQGTIGYLDPSYFYTGRLTERSDVFSFGVILVELLTRKKPFSYLTSDGEGLVAHFVRLLEEGNISQILDPQVIEEGGKEVQEVSILAASCINLRAEERPTMREVEHALEGLQVSKNKGSMVMSFKKGSMVRDEFEDDDGVEMT
ncbi:wall-associated receptor kinase 2-like [Panicum hallii]|uniref:wall-associated receptor kinase 2-like n=1 Tax=Panicum hallii TaxID=206008 RepID=UPI000DF4EB9E|nr:wall-associated receptor kinase 2-like [Panicum hallii]